MFSGIGANGDRSKTGTVTPVDGTGLMVDGLFGHFVENLSRLTVTPVDRIGLAVGRQGLRLMVDGCRTIDQFHGFSSRLIAGIVFESGLECQAIGQPR